MLSIGPELIRFLAIGGFKMRRMLFVITGAVLAIAPLVIGSRAEAVRIRGDYVEVRTASVFAGACHFNGEVTTTGRDALMAWHITSGSWQGVPLKGVKVVAIITSDSNLSETDIARRSEIVVDTAATEAQASAVVEALKKNYAGAVGNVAHLIRAPVNFNRTSNSYSVDAGSLASINVQAMPDDLCCKMPNLVWYSPLVPLKNRKVGFTANANYGGDDFASSWQRSGENSAFYGTFEF